MYSPGCSMNILGFCDFSVRYTAFTNWCLNILEYCSKYTSWIYVEYMHNVNTLAIHGQNAR